MDIAKESENSAKVLPKSRRRSSFFGYEIAGTSDERKNEDEKKTIENHIKKLELELTEWPKQYISTKSSILNFWNNQDKLVDEGNVTSEQKEYLSEAVNVNEYFEKHKAMSGKIEPYILKKDYYIQKYNYCLDLIQEKTIQHEQQQLMDLKHNDSN